MKLSVWFDPNVEEHMRAYKYLEDNACWPEDFPPDHIEIDTNWQLLIMAKLAREWVDYFFEGAEKINGRLL